MHAQHVPSHLDWFQNLAHIAKPTTLGIVADRGVVAAARGVASAEYSVENTGLLQSDVVLEMGLSSVKHLPSGVNERARSARTRIGSVELSRKVAVLTVELRRSLRTVTGEASETLIKHCMGDIGASMHSIRGSAQLSLRGAVLHRWLFLFVGVRGVVLPVGSPLQNTACSSSSFCLHMSIRRAIGSVGVKGAMKKTM